ncbi:MAG: hypothetical protein HY092_01835 [Candidatus Kerfeldbacteria bacterium]|nr:hypothetical protein [Candidatus Kerfeldbacteria bacterium]
MLYLRCPLHFYQQSPPTEKVAYLANETIGCARQTHHALEFFCGHEEMGTFGQADGRDVGPVANVQALGLQGLRDPAFEKSITSEIPSDSINLENALSQHFPDTSALLLTFEGCVIDHTPNIKALFRLIQLQLVTAKAIATLWSECCHEIGERLDSNWTADNDVNIIRREEPTRETFLNDEVP